MPDQEATQRILASYSAMLNDPDGGPVVWVALAVSQSKVGRLEDAVRDRAVAIVDAGEGLDRWREDPKLLARRIAALAKARAQLTGPQPSRKRLRPPKRHISSLAPGDLLAYTASNGRLALLRVARIDDNRYSVAPILVALDFDKTSLPSGWRLRRLTDRRRVKHSPLAKGPRPPWDTVVFRASSFKGDFRDAAFTVVGSFPTRDGDERLQAQLYGDWSGLARTIEYNVGVVSSQD